MGDIAVIQWIDSHGITCLIIFWFISAAIGAMDAPTATSSGFYKWFFKFANAFGSNITRAFSTRVEGSPNWGPAVKKAINGGANVQTSGSGSSGVPQP